MRGGVADFPITRNPLVTGPLGVRFSAAAQLKLTSGRAIGALCVMDTEPHQADPEKLEHLRFMAEQVMATLEARQAAKLHQRARAPSEE